MLDVEVIPGKSVGKFTIGASFPLFIVEGVVVIYLFLFHRFN
jgi:hypothetical protein